MSIDHRLRKKYLKYTFVMSEDDVQRTHQRLPGNAVRLLSGPMSWYSRMAW